MLNEIAETSLPGAIAIKLRSPTYPGHSTIIDEADIFIVEKHTWTVCMSGTVTKRPYAMCRSVGHERATPSGQLYLHRLIFKTSPGLSVDHINGDPLDNRRSNLRECTHAQNMANRRPSANSPHGYRGVRQSGSRYSAAICVNGTDVELGKFATAADAARVWNVAARRHLGSFAMLNDVDESVEASAINEPLIIEKEVPLPPPDPRVKRRFNNRWPFRHMLVGDSFYTEELRGTVHGSVWGFNCKHKPMRFTYRCEGDGIRVWRTD